MDLDPKRLKVARADFPGIATFTSLSDMLRKADVNLVVLITPHNLHAEQALAALAAGKHVVCEKPFAVSTQECDAMIRLAARKGLMVSTYHNRHWDGCILNALRIVRKEKAIGEVLHVKAEMSGYGKPGDWWRTSKSISGGVLFDWGVHLLEYSLQLLKGDMVEVGGFVKNGFWADQTRWKKDTNEDEGHAVVRFDNGKWLSLTISHIDSRPKDDWIEVTGTLGSLCFDYKSWTLYQSKNDTMVTTRGRSPDSEGWRYYRNVAAHLTRGTKLVITPEWARRPIHILDTAYRSAAANRALKTKYA